MNIVNLFTLYKVSIVSFFEFYLVVENKLTVIINFAMWYLFIIFVDIHLLGLFVDDTTLATDSECRLINKTGRLHKTG